MEYALIRCPRAATVPYSIMHWTGTLLGMYHQVPTNLEDPHLFLNRQLHDCAKLLVGLSLPTMNTRWRDHPLLRRRLRLDLASLWGSPGQRGFWFEFLHSPPVSVVSLHVFLGFAIVLFLSLFFFKKREKKKNNNNKSNDNEVLRSKWRNHRLWCGQGVETFDWHTRYGGTSRTVYLHPVGWNYWREVITRQPNETFRYTFNRWGRYHNKKKAN